MIRSFTLILFFSTLVGLSCKPTQNNSADSQQFFQLTDLQKGLKTRQDACNAVANQQFNTQTEVCVNLQENCEAQKFHTWNATTSQCVVNQQLEQQYLATNCTGRGNTFVNGICVFGSGTVTVTSTMTSTSTQITP